MAILEMPAEAPDTYGLPEYKVSEMRGEIETNGHDVRVLFGAKRFKQLNWLCSMVFSPEDLIQLSRQCEALAVEAFNRAQMMDQRRKGH